MKVIAQGAEATLYKDDNDKNNCFLIKDRTPKSYRIKEIDDRLRKTRTKKEVKLMSKLNFVPKVIESDDYKIKMQFINGKLLKNVLDEMSENERRKILIEVGEHIAEMHDLNIIHGDLTTSNMIYFEGRIFFIDFGLGFVSLKDEDKAVDLHLLKQALEAKHYQHFEESYNFVMQGYKKSRNYKNVLERLDKVESRGRYKRKNAD